MICFNFLLSKPSQVFFAFKKFVNIRFESLGKCESGMSFFGHSSNGLYLDYFRNIFQACYMLILCLKNKQICAYMYACKCYASKNKKHVYIILVP